MSALTWWLVLAVALFCVGSYGVLARRNVIVIIMSLEIMLNAVNVALVAIASFRTGVPGGGTVFALFIIALAAAEVTVGMAIVVANYRHQRTVQADRYNELKG
jgi:NADH:ubiquinone oxidoreductase subunit K